MWQMDLWIIHSSENNSALSFIYNIIYTFLNFWALSLQTTSFFLYYKYIHIHIYRKNRTGVHLSLFNQYFNAIYFIIFFNFFHIDLFFFLIFCFFCATFSAYSNIYIWNSIQDINCQNLDNHSFHLFMNRQCINSSIIKYVYIFHSFVYRNIFIRS